MEIGGFASRLSIPLRTSTIQLQSPSCLVLNECWFLLTSPV